MTTLTNNYIVVGDIHFHQWTEFSKPDPEFGTDRFKEQIEAMQQVFDLARLHKATVIQVGDVFHQRATVNTLVFNKVFELFVKNSDIETVILRGNHDSITNSLYSPSSIEPLGALDNVVIVSTLAEELYSKGGLRFVYLPYGDEHEEMLDYVKSLQLNPSHTNILLGHIGVDGATSGKGNYRLNGTFTLSNLRSEEFDYILLGHYHKRQLLDGNPNAMYLGCLNQTSFSDEGTACGVQLLSIDIEDKRNDTIEFIPIKSRMFNTINGNAIPNNIDELLETSFVRFIGSNDQAKALEKLSEDIDLSTMRVMINKDYTSDMRLEIDAVSTPEEITKEYAKQHCPNAVDKALECIALARLS